MRVKAFKDFIVLSLPPIFHLLFTFLIQFKIKFHQEFTLEGLTPGWRYNSLFLFLFIVIVFVRVF